MSHTRKVCPHGVVITQCRCIKPNKATEVVRPCPFEHHTGPSWDSQEAASRPDLNRSSYCAAERHDQCPQQPGAPAPRCACPCHATGTAQEELDQQANAGAVLAVGSLTVPPGGQEKDPGVSEGSEGHTAGHETEPEPEPEPESPVFTRVDAGYAMNLLVSGRGRQPRDTWSEEEDQAEARLNDYVLGRVDGECTHPEPPVDTSESEPTICRYGHTEADHEAAGACVRKPRPHWLPEQVWMGVIAGQWPLRAFPDQGAAERWAAEAKWDPAVQRYEPRRIWAVDIPAGTQTFKVETVPASTKLSEVKW